MKRDSGLNVENGGFSGVQTARTEVLACTLSKDTRIASSFIADGCSVNVAATQRSDLRIRAPVGRTHDIRNANRMNLASRPVEVRR